MIQDLYEAKKREVNDRWHKMMKDVDDKIRTLVCSNLAPDMKVRVVNALSKDETMVSTLHENFSPNSQDY